MITEQKYKNCLKQLQKIYKSILNNLLKNYGMKWNSETVLKNI